MSETKTVTKDPICGMTVDPASALRTERDGKTSYFCSDSCKQKFLSEPSVPSPLESPDPVAANLRGMTVATTPDTSTQKKIGLI